MKHIRRFNEELRPETYLKAGRGLKRLNKIKRGANLIDYYYEKKFGLLKMFYKDVNRNSPSTAKKDAYFSHFFAVLKDYSGNTIQDEYDIINNWEKRRIDFNNNVYVRDDAGQAKLTNYELGFKFVIYATMTENSILDSPYVLKQIPYKLFNIDIQLTDICNYEEDVNILEEMKNNLIAFYSDVKDLSVDITTDRKSSMGMFIDRSNAFKFKKILPSILEEHMDTIVDLFSLLGGDPKDVENFKKSVFNISTNKLYYDSAGELKY